MADILHFIRAVETQCVNGILSAHNAPMSHAMEALRRPYFNAVSHAFVLKGYLEVLLCPVC